MEELTEVITAAEFHPLECNIFAYSSSKGTVRLCDMRKAALCDRHSKCKLHRNLLSGQDAIKEHTIAYCTVITSNVMKKY